MRSAGTLTMRTFVEPIAAVTTIVAHGTNVGVPGLSRFGQPGMIGVPGMSVIRSAGAPPTFTRACLGTGFATPSWCGQVMTALTLQIGGTHFPCGGGGRSIAPPPRHGNPRQAPVKLFVLDPHTIYRRGLVGLPRAARRRYSVLPTPTRCAEASSRRLVEADLVMLDPAARRRRATSSARRETARVLVCYV